MLTNLERNQQLLRTLLAQNKVSQRNFVEFIASSNSKKSVHAPEPDIAEWTEADTHKIVKEFLESTKTQEAENGLVAEAKSSKQLKITVAKYYLC